MSTTNPLLAQSEADIAAIGQQPRHRAPSGKAVGIGLTVMVAIGAIVAVVALVLAHQHKSEPFIRNQDVGAIRASGGTPTGQYAPGAQTQQPQYTVVCSAPPPHSSYEGQSSYGQPVYSAGGVYDATPHCQRVRVP
jgi:hypothetical protein